MIAVGWATGGGAAQILFSIFGEMVFNRGPAGIGTIWGCAGLGLLIGGARRLQDRAAAELRRTTSARSWSATSVTAARTSCSARCATSRWALVFIALSRAAVGVSSMLNMLQLLRHVADGYRGRVFSTIESMQWSVMMVSMTLAGIASQHWDPRTIGAIAGALSSTTAIFWGWAHLTGRLPEPAREGVEPEEIEVHGEPAVEQKQLATDERR